MRFGEAWALRWNDISLENKMIDVNFPEKGSNPRKLKVSDKLLAMLGSFPHDKPTVFQGSERHFARGFRRQRKKLAFKLKNNDLLRIHFHTFRHWKATMEYHKTKSPVHVQYILGHKSLNSTQLYIQLLSFDSEDFYSAVAKTVEEARQLVEAGFDFVCQMNDVSIFRKRK
jgi:integrase